MGSKVNSAQRCQTFDGLSENKNSSHATMKVEEIIKSRTKANPFIRLYRTNPSFTSHNRIECVYWCKWIDAYSSGFVMTPYRSTQWFNPLHRQFVTKLNLLQQSHECILSDICSIVLSCITSNGSSDFPTLVAWQFFRWEEAHKRNIKNKRETKIGKTKMKFVFILLKAKMFSVVTLACSMS